MPGDIVAQGIELMLYGMGTVVLFLALLVAATTAMSRLVLRFAPEKAAVPTPASTPASSETDATLAAVVTAAVHQHRRKHSGDRH